MSPNYQRQTDDVASVNQVSRISAGSTIKGDITSPYDIRIDGNFEGMIQSDSKVIVGSKAVIKGDIVCNVAELWGKVDGNIYVKDTLSLKETCIINGDLHIRRLQVDLEAVFNGKCRMITEEEFSQLTSGEQPAMYDVEPQVAEEKAEEEFTVGAGLSKGSPFAVPSNDEFPVAE